jgi:plastocyanin
MSNPAIRHAVWRYVLREGLKQETGTTLVRVGDTVTWLNNGARLVWATIVEIDQQQSKARIRAEGQEVWVGADEITSPRRNQQ